MVHRWPDPPKRGRPWNRRWRLSDWPVVVLLYCSRQPAGPKTIRPNRESTPAITTFQQTVEFGYRLNEVNGNQDTYNTFVNLGSGVRLFDYTLDMRSLNHQGLFFDT